MRLKEVSNMVIENKVGFVETPKEIAELMVELSSIKRDGKVLDTGCGRGIFLEVLNSYNYKNVYGIEIDREFYEYCRTKWGKLYNIIFGDFLSYEFKDKFDLIIGNPPYAHFNQLPTELANRVKNIIGGCEGDIYYAFIMKSISLLKEGGELIYIVPYHFFYNTYAKIVRETILKNGKLEIIIDLDEVKLFKDENPETIIFKFRKGKFNLNKEKIILLNIKTRKTTPTEIRNKALEALKHRQSNYLFDYKEVDHFKDSNAWSSFYIETFDFPSVKLGEIARVGVGLVTGFDKAFRLKRDEYHVLADKEKVLVKKFVKAVNCKRYLVDGFAYYVLINDNIKDEELLKNLYPNIYRKLAMYKTDMINRYLPKDKKWFNWQALRNYDFLMNNLNKKRIYVPVLDRKPYNRFCLGEENLLPAGDVLFIQPYNEEDLYFLLGYLNSNFFRKYYLSKGGRRGGRIAFTQKLLENIEIPLFSKDVKEEIKMTVLEILSSLRNGEDISDKEQKIEKIIYEALKNKKFEVSKSTEEETKSLEVWLYGKI